MHSHLDKGKAGFKVSLFPTNLIFIFCRIEQSIGVTKVEYNDRQQHKGQEPKSKVTYPSWFISKVALFILFSIYANRNIIIWKKQSILF